MNELHKLVNTDENETTQPKLAKAVVEPAILMAALRYALGRQSLIVSEVTDAISKNIHVFNKFQLKAFHAEITDNLKQNESSDEIYNRWKMLLLKIVSYCREQHNYNVLIGE